jgi:5'-nucleotidase
VGEIADWPAHFEYRDMAEVGIALSKRLRGELGCDIVIALTHARSVLRLHLLPSYD